MKKITLQTIKNLNLNANGLTDAEVKLQESLYGKNYIEQKSHNVWLEVLADSLKDPMILFLIVLSGVFGFLQNYQDAIILSLATIPLLLMDVFLHYRSKSATKLLTEDLSQEVTVFRNAMELKISSMDLVPGDLVKIHQGMIVPADGILEVVVDIKVDESVLTGESFPNVKNSYEYSQFIAENLNEVTIPENVFLYAGTRVLTGHGIFRILYTSHLTSYGEILKSITQISHEQTPLQKNMGKLVQYLMFGAVIFCVLLFSIRMIQGFGWLNALISAATLAIAAIPEEFPMVFTFFLGVGVYRLAKKGALVKRAVSVENLGRVTQICTDKTGTITRGELELTHVEGEEKVLEVAYYASKPELGDPLDLAIEKYLQKNKTQFSKQNILQRFPFTEDRKRETILLANVAYTKGSPETIFQLCSQDLTSKQYWIDKIDYYATLGHKVIAVAEYNKPLVNSIDEPTDGYRFLGILAFEDPPRVEVKQAIEQCHQMGIKVMMITGDHPQTSLAIGSEIGLGSNVINAENDFQKIETSELEFLKTVDIVARCSPLQKLKIINRFKEFKEIVAVTGDGVNDVPALKVADIGIAMGRRGAKSAKEVSSIIIGDDNFATIVTAILEGKKLFSNLKLSFHYLILIHLPLVFIASLIPILGYPLVFAPLHIVLLELVIHPTAILGFQGDNYFLSKDYTLFSQNSFFKILIPAGLITSILIAVFIILNQKYLFELKYVQNIIVSLLMLWSGALVVILNNGKTKSSYVIMLFTLLIAWCVFKGYFV
jgi:Ca2+-transporting ATPase